MASHNNIDLENVCRDFQAASKEMLSWKWDNRFGTALAEFSTAQQKSVLNFLESNLSMPWDGSSINQAPETLQAIAGRLGGLRMGQMLFASDSARDDFIFGVWWPWGNGQTISLRIAPYDKRLSGRELMQLITLFKGWFDL